MESLAVNRSFWQGKRVFLTGHTGFKGGWLALWLSDMGAMVHGYALEPPTEPNFFSICGVESRIRSGMVADVRDAAALIQAMHAAQPEIVLHLAAQPLVRHSYLAPAETYAVNVMGTVNLLEAVRQTHGVRAVVNVTTDKCYENREWVWGYRENETLGGFDPYSSSKACSEMVTAAYRRSFLEPAGIRLASARSGNVIGGGDWAKDRLIPDCIRSLSSGEKLLIRSPSAVRPWQHVLEPLTGYLMLAERLFMDEGGFAEAWNFGPSDDDTCSVGWILDCFTGRFPGFDWKKEEAIQPHEANFLRLDSSKARTRLGWRRRWPLETAMDKTLAWFEAWSRGEDMLSVSLRQIADYEKNQGED